MTNPIHTLGGGWLHGIRVALLTKGISITIGLPIHTADEISFCAAFHDIGKLAIPAAILEKPGRLTQEERKEIETHPLCGAKILPEQLQRNHQYLSLATIYHHERWDGTGYPFGLQGYDIPLVAQIIGAADCIDALCSERPYKSGLLPDEAVNLILHGKCGPFNRVVSQYLSSKEAREFLDIVFRTDDIRWFDRDLIRKVEQTCKEYTFRGCF